MTPAAELLAAADHLDALMARATPGPWRTHDTHLDRGGHTATVLSGEGNATDLRAWLPTWSHEPWDSARNCWNDAAYIAAMNPDVGRPLVALLRGMAAWYEVNGLNLWPGDTDNFRDLARAILATKEGT